jgi:hypothetical protein
MYARQHGYALTSLTLQQRERASERASERARHASAVTDPACLSAARTSGARPTASRPSCERRHQQQGLPHSDTPTRRPRRDATRRDTDRLTSRQICLRAALRADRPSPPAGSDAAAAGSDAADSHRQASWPRRAAPRRRRRATDRIAPSAPQRLRQHARARRQRRRLRVFDSAPKPASSWPGRARFY